ncbi:MAG: carboxymuconolactone decarboxylase family protein [bacterium]
MSVPQLELSPKRKYATIVSASLVSRREALLEADLRAALEVAFSTPELVELILQSLLFDGYPCALEGLIALQEVLRDHHIPTEEQLESYSIENVQQWRQRGLELCQKIYGKNFDKLLKNVDNLSPTLKEWMLVEGYGRVLSRNVLSMDVREMGIIAILTVKDLQRQLFSHLRGALHLGVSMEKLRAAILLCRTYANDSKIESALRTWSMVNGGLS